ncbi:MAG: GGDEF domain-containing protein, partial [Pseudorhodoplanes sp.]
NDIAAIVMDELELRAIVMRDSLTGALSRRAFRQEASRAISLARRHDHSLSCVVFDLDHFKAINDENGHAIGDLVLKACLDVCRTQLRGSDLIGRIGGEEFAIVLPHTASEAAMEVAHKLRQAFGTILIPGKHASLRFSASFGVSTQHSATRDIDDLLQNADEALYAAKAAGRNACLLWQPRDEPHVADALRRVFKAARISFNAGRSTIDCTVRGLSDRGASLDMASTAGIPQRFKLQIGSESSRLCSVANVKGNNVRVEFAQPSNV